MSHFSWTAGNRRYIAAGGHMAELQNFASYGGCFPTTASITAALAHAGVIAPHTGEPFSEAFLMGVSGGIAFGYFTFAYSGHDPQVNLITRNTFRNYGWDATLERLRIAADVAQSTSPDKARDKLEAALEAGHAPIVWADTFTLGYDNSEFGEGMWQMSPLIVTAYERGGQAVICDRAAVPISVSAELLDAARARVKKEKHRLVILERPDSPDLAAEVRAGIEDAQELFAGNPPVGSGKNWGANGYELWIERLRKADSKESWAKLMPAGASLFAGLTTAFKYGLLFWKDQTQSADRMMFADFLDQAATIAGATELADVAGQFRGCGELWRELGEVLLPDPRSDAPGAVPAILGEARELLIKRHAAFAEHGSGDELAEIDKRFEAVKARADEELSDSALIDSIKESVAEHVSKIRDAEVAAMGALKQALG